MKPLGIIGGLGPMATAYFMRLIVEMTAAGTDQEHMEVFIHSRPQIPDRTKYILGISGENPLPQMAEAGRGLVAQGAQVIAIPCVTAHFFCSQLEAQIACPVINAIEATVEYLAEHRINHVGIMATDGTIQSGLFHHTLEKYHILCTQPETGQQRKVMEMIYHQAKAGLAIDRGMADEVAESLFAKGVQVILLGCTELSMMKMDFPLGKGFLDVMEVLARRAVLACGRLKEGYHQLIT